MDSLIQTFHLDVKLLIAQFVNFAIVAGVLYFFALKPVMKIMKDRTEKIEKSLIQAKEIDVKFHQTSLENKQILSTAQKEAQAIINKAKAASEIKKQEMLEQAKLEMDKIVGQGKIQISLEKDKMFTELKSELVELVVMVSEKVLGQKVDQKTDRELINESIKGISKKHD